MYAYESKQADNKVQREKKAPVPSVFNKPDLPPVQMLKSLDEFKEESGLWLATRQADILAIDNALSTYNTLCTQTDLWTYPKRIPALIISLNEVKRACNDYPQVKITRRTRNIQPLKNQIVVEMTVLKSLQSKNDTLTNLVPQRDYKNAGAEDEAEDEAEAEAARQTGLIRKRYWADYIIESVTVNLLNQSEMLKKLHTSAKAEIDGEHHNADIGAFTGFFRDDYRRIADDENTPAELRHVLQEALQYAGDVPVGSLSKNATLYKPGLGPGGGRYGINLKLSQSLTKESEGDYLHEMTHILAQKAYHNTPMHLGLPENSVQADYTELYQHRNNEAKALKQSIQQEHGADESDFTEDQLQKLSDKLKYGAFDDKTFSYIPKFKTLNDPAKEVLPAAKAAEITRNILVAMGGEVPAEEEGGPPPNFNPAITTALTRTAQGEGGSSIFIEYDAVINQMMMWCHNWGIPPDNPVYSKLRQMAQHEYTRREAARNPAPAAPPGPPAQPVGLGQ